MLTLVPRYITWPLGSAEQVDPVRCPLYKLPLELVQLVDQYGNWYQTGFAHQRLTWLHHLSRITLTWQSPLQVKPWELICTLPQVHVLKQFDYRETIPLPELLEVGGSGFTLEQLQEIIKPILEAGLLSITDEYKTVRLNVNWRPEQRKMNFAPLSLANSRTHLFLSSKHHPQLRHDQQQFDRDSFTSRKKSSLASGEDMPFLSDQRRYWLQAFIIRVLKRHERLSTPRLAQLVREEAHQAGPLAFEPADAHLQLVLDQLEDKQYVEYDRRQDLFVYIP